MKRKKPTSADIFRKANKLMKEGYERKQAFAIAYKMLGEPRRYRNERKKKH